MTVTLLLACKPSGMKNFGNMQISRGKTADDVILFFFLLGRKTINVLHCGVTQHSHTRRKPSFTRGNFFSKKIQKVFFKRLFLSGRSGVFGGHAGMGDYFGMSNTFLFRGCG